MRKLSRKGLVRKLDQAFSRKVRSKARDHLCELCKKEPHSQVFHFITRAKHSVRWDLGNAVASCGGCNMKYEYDQTFIDWVFGWYKRNFGLEAWERLKFDSNKIAKFSNSDLQEMYERYK